MNTSRRPWVIILAGGAGRRLHSVTTGAREGAVPKQFCRLGGPRSLLATTLERARAVAGDDRIRVVVLEAHRHWWAPELATLLSGNMLVEPESRGTALALLRALLHVRRRDPRARVVVLPSDHAVDDEIVLHDTILEALELAARRPGRVTLLGAPATAADPALGWIVPARPDAGPVRRVVEFVEKPGSDRAAGYVQRGALRSTLIMVGGVQAMLDLYAFAQPAHFANPGERSASFPAEWPGWVTIPWAPASLDLGRDILEIAASRLGVLTLPECGWTDIGTPERLHAWWLAHPEAHAHARRHGILPPAPVHHGMERQVASTS